MFSKRVSRLARSLKPRLSYANVMATIAVFVALGGSSYAALKVGTKQLRNGAVTSVKIKNGAVVSKKINRKTRRALRGTKGPAGPAGAQGPAGPAGAQGPAGSVRAYARVHGGSLQFVGAHPGFTAVRRAPSWASGQYCLALAAGSGVDPNIAVASGGAPATTTAVAAEAGEPNLCNANEVQVQLTSVADPSNHPDSEFNVIAP
jgi:hypothetical protein